MTAEIGRMKALAGLLNNDADLSGLLIDEDLYNYNDDLFFSGSVKQKQQFIVDKLSKNAPMKDNNTNSGVTTTTMMIETDTTQPPSHISDNDNADDDDNNENDYDNSGEVQFGQSADPTSFVASSVRQRAAAMSGFLTKKKDGPTSGQARAMEWRGGGGGGGAQHKIAPTFVSKFDHHHRGGVGGGENDVNGGTPTNNNDDGAIIVTASYKKMRPGEG